MDDFICLQWNFYLFYSGEFAISGGHLIQTLISVIFDKSCNLTTKPQKVKFINRIYLIQFY